jgi:hypothetical protein
MTEFIWAIQDPADIYRLNQAGIDPGVPGFALAVSLLAAIFIVCRRCGEARKLIPTNR